MLTSLIILFVFQTSGGSIAGKLLDYDSRQPIVAARIVLEKTAYKTISNKAGEFTLPDIPPGTYRLNIFHPQYAGGGPKLIMVRKDSVSHVEYRMIQSPAPNLRFIRADTSNIGQ